MPGRDDDNDIENNENASPNADADATRSAVPPPPPPPGPPPAAKQTGSGSRPSFDAEAFKNAKLKKVDETPKPKEQNSGSKDPFRNVAKYNQSRNTTPSDIEDENDPESDNEWENEEEENRIREENRRRIQAEIAQKKADAAKAEEVRAAERAAAQAQVAAEKAPEAAQPPRKKPLTLNARLAAIQAANTDKPEDDWDNMDVDPVTEPTATHTEEKALETEEEPLKELQTIESILLGTEEPAPAPAPSAAPPLPLPRDLKQPKEPAPASMPAAGAAPPPPPPPPPPTRARTGQGKPPPVAPRQKPDDRTTGIEQQLRQKITPLIQLTEQHREKQASVNAQWELINKKISLYYEVCAIGSQRIRENPNFLNTQPDYKPKVLELANEIVLIKTQLDQSIVELNDVNAAFARQGEEWDDLYREYKNLTSKQTASDLRNELKNQHQLKGFNPEEYNKRKIPLAIDLIALAQNAAQGIAEWPTLSGTDNQMVTQQDFDAIFIPPLPRDVVTPQDAQPNDPMEMEAESAEPDLGPAPAIPPRARQNATPQPEQPPVQPNEPIETEMEAENTEPDLGPAPPPPVRTRPNVTQQPEQPPVQPNEPIETEMEMEAENTEPDLGPAPAIPPRARQNATPQPEQPPVQPNEPIETEMEAENTEPDLGPAPAITPRARQTAAPQPEQPPVQPNEPIETEMEMEMEAENTEPDLGPAPPPPVRTRPNVAQQPEQPPVQPSVSQPRMPAAEEPLPPPTFEPLVKSIGFAYNRPITPKHDQERLSSTAPNSGRLTSVTSTLGANLTSLTAYLSVDSNRKSCDVKKYQSCNLPWDNNHIGLEINMKSVSAIPNKVYAYESNEKGLTFAVNRHLPENDNVATIRNVCKMAVGSAKPDAVFDLTKTPDNKKDLVFEHLNNAIEALKAKAQADGKDLTSLKFPTITGYTPSQRSEPPKLTR